MKKAKKHNIPLPPINPTESYLRTNSIISSFKREEKGKGKEFDQPDNSRRRASSFDSARNTGIDTVNNDPVHEKVFPVQIEETAHNEEASEDDDQFILQEREKEDEMIRAQELEVIRKHHRRSHRHHRRRRKKEETETETETETIPDKNLRRQIRSSSTPSMPFPHPNTTSDNEKNAIKLEAMRSPSLVPHLLTSPISHASSPPLNADVFTSMIDEDIKKPSFAEFMQEEDSISTKRDPSLDLINSRNSIDEIRIVPDYRRAKFHVADNGNRIAVITHKTFIEIVEFLFSLCKAMHQAGLPASRVESKMRFTANRFGIESSFAIFPTYFIIILKRKSDVASHTYVMGNNSNVGFDFAKLEQADLLAYQVANKQLSISQGVEKLKIMHEQKKHFSFLPLAISCYLKIILSARLFYGGGLYEMIYASILAVPIALIIYFTSRYGVLLRLQDFLVSFTSGFLAVIALKSEFLGALLPNTLVLCGILPCLPGYTMNTSIVDLAAKTMVAGTAKLFYCFFICFTLGLGLICGIKLFFSIISSCRFGNVILPGTDVFTPSVQTQLSNYTPVPFIERYTQCLFFDRNEMKNTMRELLLEIQHEAELNATRSFEDTSNQKISQHIELIEQTISSESSTEEISLPRVPIPLSYEILIVLFYGFLSGISLQATWRQMPLVIISFLSSWGMWLLKLYIGNDLSNMLTMAVITIGANLYERYFHVPNFLPIQVAGVLLVPSSSGVRGMFNSMTSSEGNYVGLLSTFGFFVVVAELVVGVTIGNALVPLDKLKKIYKLPKFLSCYKSNN